MKDGLKVSKLPAITNPTLTDYAVQDNAGGTITQRTLWSYIKKLFVYNNGLGAPSISGVAGTIAISSGGNDASHEVSINVNASQAPGVTIATVTFSSAFSATPKVVFSPSNDNAADHALTDVSVYMVGASTTTYIIKSGALGFAGGVTCKWNVHVLQ